MAKSIISVGFEIPGHSDKFLHFSSDQSLLDFDIIVFQPDIADYILWSEQYQGKPSLNEDQSFRLREHTARWRQELLNAYDHGKTIFVFMSEKQEVFLDTGNRQYSGTGRNRQTTRIVESFHNYKAIPFTFDEIVGARGKETKPVRDLKLLALYWAAFKEYSAYEVYFTSKIILPALVTKTGGKMVAGLVRGKSGSGKGTMVLLPPIRYSGDQFVKKHDGKSYWNKDGRAFGGRFVSALIEIDKVVSADRQQTPMPDWVKGDEFRLSGEAQIEKEITAHTKQIDDLYSAKTELLRQLEKEARLKRLLYETGSALEDAILDALAILGLEAKKHRDSESEFDVLFTWEGQRFLGEAEGKDNKAINIDKMSQLERNLNEDFAREDVQKFAKGMLFGNAFRLQNLTKRGDFFTEKCIVSAARLKAALIRTPDLFLAARYVRRAETATSPEGASKQLLLRREQSSVSRLHRRENRSLNRKPKLNR